MTGSSGRARVGAPRRSGSAPRSRRRDIERTLAHDRRVPEVAARVTAIGDETAETAETARIGFGERERASVDYEISRP
jgi:hypothetical protein